MNNEAIYPFLIPNWTNRSKCLVNVVFFIFFIIFSRTSYASTKTFALIIILCLTGAIRWIVTYVIEMLHAMISVVDILLNLSEIN